MRQGVGGKRIMEEGERYRYSTKYTHFTLAVYAVCNRRFGGGRISDGEEARCGESLQSYREMTARGGRGVNI